MKEIMHVGVESMRMRRPTACGMFPIVAPELQMERIALRDGHAVTRRRLIAINDSYSAGFRAGYFQRD